MTRHALIQKLALEIKQEAKIAALRTLARRTTEAFKFVEDRTTLTPGEIGARLTGLLESSDNCPKIPGLPAEHVRLRRMLLAPYQPQPEPPASPPVRRRAGPQ